jgi:signal peptidase II
MTNDRRKYVVFGVLGALVIALDQWTKILARHHLPQLGHRGRDVVANFFKLRFSENTGVAFGMLQSMPGGRILLTLVALGAFLLVLHYLRKTDPDHLRLHVALGLVGGGAVGNLIDRIMYGRVTDFIVWYYRDHEWPAFNIADAALVVGVALMAIDMIGASKATAPAPAAVDGKDR